MPNSNKIEVLVAYTTPEMWKVVQRRKIANQRSDKKDAKYIAFLLIRRKNNQGEIMPSTITHIAKVKEIRHITANKNYYEKNMPEILILAETKGWNNEHQDKEYVLEEIKKLKRPISAQKGDRKGQVCFYTTTEELKKAKHIGDIKTESQLNCQ
jgi:hypothetical protein